MSSSRCPSPSRRSPSRTNACSTTSCSAPAPKPCARSPPIRNTWAPKSASSRSCIPGGRICNTIRTCTAWSRAAASPRTANTGSPVAPVSSCPCGSSHGCSGVCFSQQLRHAFDTGALRFYGQLEPLADARAFAAFLAPAAQAEWVVYAKPPFGDARHVLDYLGRYTHRVAISNNRLLQLRRRRTSPSGGKTTSTTPQHKTMTLDGRRIHPPLPAACAARRLQAHSQLRVARQSPPAARLATCRRLLGVVPPADAIPEPDGRLP